MSMRGAVAGCMVLVCLVVLLAERTEGHLTFFSPKEMMEMKKLSKTPVAVPGLRPKSMEQEGKKAIEPRSEDGQREEATIQDLPEVESDRNPDKTVEIAIRMSAKQLDHVASVLEGRQQAK